MCNLRKFRTKQRLSQIELAEKLNIPKPYIAMWETGKTSPNCEYSKKFAEFFDVTLDEFLK